MSSSHREDFMLIAAGPSNYAPYLAGWQEFKDDLRKIVDHQPGWTEVMPGPNEGQSQGWCRLERKSDAEAAYRHYASARGILVHLFKTSRTSGEYRLLKCNCYPHFPGIDKHNHSAHRSGIDVGGVNKYMSQMSGHSGRYMAPAASSYGYSAYPQQPSAYMVSPSYAGYGMPTHVMAPQMPVYAANSSGFPVNVRSGAFLTEARGIFLSGLSYSMGPNDLVALLNTVGRPVDTQLHTDRTTGRFKGTATAKFATKEEAEFAVKRLDQTRHMGKVINVRLDTNRTIVGQVDSPVVVNGSTYSRYGAQT